MPWAKIDDQLHANEKFASVSLAATGLWTLALSWTTQQLKDGFVPLAILRRFAGAETATVAAELVATGLWDEVEGGYTFHDYLQYNPPAEKVLAEREAAKERMTKRRYPQVQTAPAQQPTGSAQPSVDTDDTEKTCSPELRPNFATCSPSPVPVPVPSVSKETQSISPLPPTATKPAAAVSGPVKVYDPQTPIPPAVEAFLAEQPDPPRWRSWLLDELRGREYHSLERYALQILRECKRRGGPPDTASRKLRVLSREEATQSIRRGLETVMTQGDGF
jgi:hypothetical protein